ncbi:alpha/beta hydrolase family protein [Planctomicrobium sp. SH664]|uniref:alpha/beta hydrolase family protein n=1 Tax=Planctomicrobium sp. SH664 TaxID=3448125 RepID=UPI003F5C2BF1
MSDPGSVPSRRELLQWIGAGMAVAPGLDCSLLFGDPPEYQPLQRYPRMVHEYMLRECRESSARRQAMLDRLKTKEDAEKYVLSARARARDCFGLPHEKTPLNPRVMAVIERDQYRIENVIFESRPDFYVTANLYLPIGRSHPVPGVVASCGHSANGKAGASYQSFAQGLARLGYACLIFDPIGQGERLQYPDKPLRSGPGVDEHLRVGNQMHIVGENFATWRAWDAIRALDYLLTRPEIDPQHIGITGNSGGGTMTTWLCALDDRWTMAAPGCFVTTFLRNLENELPTDPEQCPPRAMALDLDHSEFLAAMAPRPIIILAKERDFFDVRGAEESYLRLKRLYQLLGAEENIALFVGPTGHGYTQENREALYSWFNRATHKTPEIEGVAKTTTFTGVLNSSAKLPYQPEPDLVIEKDQVLRCTTSGRVSELFNSRRVCDYTRYRALELHATRPALSGSELTRAVRELLRLKEVPPEIPDYNIWRELAKGRGYPMRAVGYAVETEPGIQAIVYSLTRSGWASRPARLGDSAILFLPHHSSDQELREEPLIQELLNNHPGVPFFSCDVRGIGDSWPGTVRNGNYEERYGADHFYATQSIMHDRPYVGQRTFDVLRVLQWLRSFGYEKVHLVGRGWGTFPATFAALLSPQVQQITLKNALTSYQAIAETPNYRWPLSAMLPNVLTRFDLPDCYAALQSRQLRQIDPWDALAGKDADVRS